MEKPRSSGNRQNISFQAGYTHGFRLLQSLITTGPTIRRSPGTEDLFQDFFAAPQEITPDNAPKLFIF